MPKLYLLRHAQADSSLSTKDQDRSLTSHGVEQIKSVIDSLKDIDIALCSSAKRTCMTLAAITDAGVNIKKTTYLETLYNAPAGEILNALKSCSAKNILIVAHNPGIHQLASTLVGDGKKSQVEKLKLFYQPATLSIFDCPVENWGDIQPQENTLLDLIIPD